MKILEEVMRLRFTLHPRFGPISGFLPVFSPPNGGFVIAPSIRNTAPRDFLFPPNPAARPSTSS